MKLNVSIFYLQLISFADFAISWPEERGFVIPGSARKQDCKS